MKTSVQTNIIIAVVLGVLAGFFGQEYVHIYSMLGNGFITILKYIVVPLVFASLVTGVISLGSLDSLRSLGIKTFVYFVATTAIASSIGVVLAVIVNPGKGFIYDQAGTKVVAKALSFKEMAWQLIPTDFMQFISGGNMLFVIALALTLGVAFVTLKQHIGFPLNELFEGFNEFMMILTHWVIVVSPIGIFGLIAKLVITTGTASFIPLIKYMAVVAVGLAIHAFIVLPFILKSVVKCSPVGVAKDVFTSLTTGFSTASSAATLPVLMEDTREKLKVPNKVASFVLPLGITINMDGTGLFQSVAAIFIAQIYGVELSLVSYGVIVAFTILASVGAAAIPSAGVITLAMILTAIGVPIEGAAIIIGIDRVLDMMRTTVNLWGNTIASLVLTKWLGSSAYEH
jgi:Na+/H+-dicarboxylate symporter